MVQVIFTSLPLIGIVALPRLLHHLRHARIMLAHQRFKLSPCLCRFSHCHRANLCCHFFRWRHHVLGRALGGAFVNAGRPRTRRRPLLATRLLRRALGGHRRRDAHSGAFCVYHRQGRGCVLTRANYAQHHLKEFLIVKQSTWKRIFLCDRAR